MNFQQEIHFSPGIERALLGAILIEKSAFGRVYGILHPEIFYYEGHQQIFSTVRQMWENDVPIDTLTVVRQLMKKNISEIKADSESGATAYYIPRCTNEVVNTANLEYWSLLLREMHIEREMLKITQSGMHGKDAWKYMDELQETLVQLRQIKLTDDFKTMDEILVNLQSHMDLVKDKNIVGITTGFKILDKLTGGLMNGGLYLIGARPRVGKSAFMGKMVIAQATKGFNVAVMSLEMEEKSIAARLSSLVTEVEFWRIYRNRMEDQKQADHFYNSINTMGHLPIRISDTAQVDMNDIKAKVAKLKQRGQIDILYIDYLQLIEAEFNKNKNREQEVAKLSRGLKILAKEYKIPVVVLAQLNRLSEDAKEKKPRLHNLRESGSLEQDADGVIFLHSDFKSGIKYKADGSSTENEADVIIAKWRDGEEGEYKIGFDGPRMKFYEFDEAKKQAQPQPFKHTMPVKNFYETGDPDDSPF